MARIYWVGLGLVWIGLGLMIVPAGDLKFLTFLLGLAVQAMGTIFLFLGIIRTRRKKGGVLDRKSYIILILSAILFLVGVTAGVFTHQYLFARAVRPLECYQDRSVSKENSTDTARYPRSKVSS